MNEQLAQVAKTYTTQRLMRWLVALSALFLLPMLVAMGFAHRSNSDAMLAGLLAGMPMMWSTVFLVGHAKSQFAHPRARLMPGFLWAHLIVLVGVLLTLFLAMPLLVAALSNASLLGLIALTLSIGVPALWGAQLTRFAPTLISLLVFYSMLTQWGQQFWITDAAMHREVHALLVVTGLMLVLVWLWRLSNLREEMDEYQNVFAAALGRRSGTEAVEQRRLVAMQLKRVWLFGRISDWWYSRLGGYYGGSQLGLIRLLRYGSSAIPNEIQGVMFSLMAIAAVIFFTQFSFFAHKPGGMGATFFIVQFGVVMPGQLAGEILAQRRPRTASELLLPVSRRRLVDGLFAVSARNTITLWLMLHLAIGLTLAVCEQPITLQMAAMFGLLSATTTLASMGLSLRLSVWPSLAKRMLVSMFAWAVLLPPLFVLGSMNGEWSAGPFIAIAIALVAFGIWAIRSARNAWLNLEFV